MYHHQVTRFKTNGMIFLQNRKIQILLVIMMKSEDHLKRKCKIQEKKKSLILNFNGYGESKGYIDKRL